MIKSAFITFPFNKKHHDVNKKQTYNIKEIFLAIENENFDKFKSLITNLNPYDKADILNSLPDENFESIIKQVFDILEEDVLMELNQHKIEILIENIEKDDLLHMLLKLDLDDLSYFVSHLNDEIATIILEDLPKKERKYVKHALTYNENQVGRIMDFDFLTFSKHDHVKNVKEILMESNDIIANDSQDIFIIDESTKHLIGTVKLIDILTTNDEKPLISIIDEDFKTARDTDEISEIVYIFGKYNVSSIAILDRYDNIVGFVSSQAGLEILKEEMDDKMLKIGGISEDYIEIGVLKKSYSRAIWLCINLITSLISASIISQFETVIEKNSYLTLFLPVVASIGGNSGNQISAFTIRLINARYINIINQYSIFLREILSSLFASSLILAISFLFGFLIAKSYLVACLFASAVGCNIVFSSIFGLIIPFVIKRFKLDPALTSSIFVTCLTDFFGFFIFLTLVSIFLK